jgi:hypothetical protein
MAQQQHINETEAAHAAGSSTVVTMTHYNHKPLMPLAATDVLLFLIIGIALFVASGAGVGGGEVLLLVLLHMLSQRWTVQTGS